MVKVGDDFAVKAYAAQIARGLGAFLSEGMGQVLVNPQFLQATTEGHPKIEVEKEQDRQSNSETVTVASKQSSLQNSGDTPALVAGDASDRSLIAWINAVQQRCQCDHIIIEAVNNFIRDKSTRFPPGEITPSQWGAIRAIAQAATSYETMMPALFAQEEGAGFLEHGRLEKVWRMRKNLLFQEISAINNQIGPDYARIFTVNLCSAMAKWASQQKKGD